VDPGQTAGGDPGKFVTAPIASVEVAGATGVVALKRSEKANRSSFPYLSEQLGPSDTADTLCSVEQEDPNRFMKWESLGNLMKKISHLSSMMLFGCCVTSGGSLPVAGPRVAGIMCRLEFGQVTPDLEFKPCD
jgi:hypothetical protein